MAAKKRKKKASKTAAKPVVHHGSSTIPQRHKKTRAKKTKHKMPSHASITLGHIIRQLEDIREGIDPDST